MSKSGYKFTWHEADTCHLSATLSLRVVFIEGKPMFRNQLFSLVPSVPLLSVVGSAASVGKLLYSQGLFLLHSNRPPQRAELLRDDVSVSICAWPRFPPFRSASHPRRNWSCTESAASWGSFTLKCLHYFLLWILQISLDMPHRGFCWGFCTSHHSMAVGHPLPMGPKPSFCTDRSSQSSWGLARRSSLAVSILNPTHDSWTLPVTQRFVTDPLSFCRYLRV